MKRPIIVIEVSCGCVLSVFLKGFDMSLQDGVSAIPFVLVDWDNIKAGDQAGEILAEYWPKNPDPDLARAVEKVERELE